MKRLAASCFPALLFALSLLNRAWASDTAAPSNAASKGDLAASASLGIGNGVLLGGDLLYQRSGPTVGASLVSGGDIFGPQFQGGGPTVGYTLSSGGLRFRALVHGGFRSHSNVGGEFLSRGGEGPTLPYAGGQLRFSALTPARFPLRLEVGVHGFYYDDLAREQVTYQKSGWFGGPSQTKTATAGGANVGAGLFVGATFQAF